MHLFETYQLWLKAFHIIFVISWMAGLFYLPRLFVYHAMLGQTSQEAKTFKIMEYRLDRMIMIPAMILSLFSGIILGIVQDTWSFGWMHLKLFGVLGLVVFHHLLSRWRYELDQGTCSHSHKFFRVMNELPLVFLLIIVISVVVKPF